jgi:rhodanese-related sulfurtransferase/predicted double-glycine peptidase
MDSYRTINNRTRSLLLWICTIVTLTGGRLFAADEIKQDDTNATPAIRKSSAPYCGLYCIYTVLKLAGQEIDFRELAKSEYLGSSKGSSLAELKKAAEDCGLYAVSVSRLADRDLRQSDYPVILHVKSEIGSGQYDHYKLFLGTKDDQAQLFDPPNTIRTVPFSEMAPYWDGNGLIVSTERIDLGVVLAPTRKRFIIYASIALVIILIVHRTKRWLSSVWEVSRRQMHVLSAAQGASFVLVAFLCAIVHHFVNEAGLLANADATAMIQQAHAGNFIPKIGEKKVHELLDSDTVFIDARFARDYKVGHIEEAISVPVDANDVERRKATSDITNDSPIVVYCQSSRCKYAEIVAVKLKDEGYSNISIFRGGWVDWVAKNGKPKEEAI